MKERKRMILLQRKCSQKSLQVQREARKMEKERHFVLTVEGAFIQKALVWEEKLMIWLFFWRNITLLYLLVQGRLTIEKKLKNIKIHAMHWRLAAQQHMPSSLILKLPIIWLHLDNIPCSILMVLVFRWAITEKFKPKGRVLSSLNIFALCALLSYKFVIYMPDDSYMTLQREWYLVLTQWRSQISLLETS